MKHVLTEAGEETYSGMLAICEKQPTASEKLAAIIRCAELNEHWAAMTRRDAEKWPREAEAFRLAALDYDTIAARFRAKAAELHDEACREHVEGREVA